MKSMWDAAFPPATPPTGFTAAAGYLGGDTPHPWTIDEWARLGRTPKLPIWVQSNPQNGHPEAEAFAALSRLYHIGCPPGHAVALDLEMAVNPGYVNAFHKVMKWAGFKVWVYGSRSVVMRNPECDGYWVADYTGTPHMLDRPVRAVQWTDGTQFDQSVVRYWQWRNHLWR